MFLGLIQVLIETNVQIGRILICRSNLQWHSEWFECPKSLKQVLNLLSDFK